jgi:hypothetical protein
MNPILRKELLLLYEKSEPNVNSVGYGFKKVNGIETGELAIIYGVNEKKPVESLSSSELIPRRININGESYQTDVNQQNVPELITCYTDPNNANIQRLRGNPVLLAPTKGGNQILQFPTSWVPAPGGGYFLAVGTLGFFAIDNFDNRVVGVTNSHVACYKRVYCSERDPLTELTDPYNTAQPHIWTNVNTDYYYPGALVSNAGALYQGYTYLKRYMPVSNTAMNYADCALMVGNPEVGWIDSNSYQMWGPTDQPQYTGYMPFASPTEIDNMLSTNPNLYSTGRTTGPKGWGPGPSCRLRCSRINEFTEVSDGQFLQDWGDCIRFEYQDGSVDPVAGGDSGSCLWADFSGTWKIVGLVFAGNPTLRYGLANRIDRVAAAMNIRAWDAGYTLNNTVPTQVTQSYPIGAPEGAQATVTVGGRVYYQAGFAY